jgi:hypothetical protein
MMRRRRGAGAQGRNLLAAVLALAGCSAPLRPGAPAMRDSAGITILESSAPRWHADSAPAVADSPLVEIGVFRELSGAVRLSDGRIVVTTVNPPTLRFYSATGQSLYNAGGPGDGATALTSAYSLSRGRGDTLAVYDLARRRVVRFDANGAGVSAIVVSDALMPAGSNGYLPRGLAPDGRYLLQREEVPYPFPGGEWEVRPDSTRIFWFDQQGQLADSTSRLLAGEIFGLSIPAIGTPLRLPLARPFAPTIRVAPGPEFVWTGDGLSWELLGRDGSGAVRRIVRIARARDSLTPAFRDSFIVRYQARHPLSGPPTLQSGFANLLPRAPYPSHLPAFTEIVAGADSTIWVQRSGLLEGLPGDLTLQWTVLGPDGAWFGDLTVPAGFRPTDIGRDWVLGLRTVEGRGVRVQLLPLVSR